MSWSCLCRNVGFAPVVRGLSHPYCTPVKLVKKIPVDHRDADRIRQEYIAEHWDDSVTRDHPNVQRLKRGLFEGSRAALAESITLVESRNPNRRAQGQFLLAEVMAEQSRRVEQLGIGSLVFRIAISGSPGVGKSSFIETFGKYLIDQQQKKVAVLTIDPSSHTSGGSILGDMTRMVNLSADPNAFIRSSPTRGTLGGVTRGTHEAMVMCEGAGFNTVLIETVGVGQSEASVADMVDMFVLLISPAHGDELQGMKRGIVEMADLIVVTKSDGDLIPQARMTQGEYLSALKYMQPRIRPWKPDVLRASSHTKEGIPEVYEVMTRFWETIARSGDLKRNRTTQLMNCMWQNIENELLEVFRVHPEVLRMLPLLKHDIITGKMTPTLAAQTLLRKFLNV